MLIQDRSKDTICAVATPPGYGGISVVRVSGPSAVETTRKLCAFLPANPESHRVYYGFLKDSKAETKIDEVLVTYFESGRSFTNENVIEISCHGNPLICGEIISVLVDAGCRVAERGEFTFRAFMNGRIDLTQAEGVLDLIHSNSSNAAQAALRHLGGDTKKLVLECTDGLEKCLAHIEASIDFSLENLETESVQILVLQIKALKKTLAFLVEGYLTGKLIKEGIRVVLSGVPNVGKSSLLNLLAQEDKAIVTDIPGTTRDLVEGEALYQGQKYVFVDTAGVRDGSADLVESIGIERSLKSLKDTDIVISVVEALGSAANWKQMWDRIPDDRLKDTLFFFNKTDLVKDLQSLRLSVGELLVSYYNNRTGMKLSLSRVIFGSAKDKSLRADVFTAVHDLALPKKAENSSCIASARQYEALKTSLVNLEKAAESLSSGVGAEFVSLEMQEALLKLYEITGKHFDDQILDKVFKEFCLGK